MRWSRKKLKAEAQDLPVDESGDQPLEPPTHARVLARAHVLLVLGVHGEIASSHPDDQPGADRIRGEMATTGAWEEASDEERALLRTPVASWSRQQMVDASWRYEGAGVLAWWLGLAELPAIDEAFSAASLVAAMTPPQDRLTVQAVPSAARTAEELEHLCNQLFTIHWRLRDQGLNPRHMDLEAFAAGAWFGPLTIEGVELEDGDLAIGGAPLLEASPEDVSTTMSCVMERRLAAQWLRGETADYGEGSLDT